MSPLFAVALLACAARAGGIEVRELEPRSRAEEIRLMLDHAIWNPRVSAVYELGEMGEAALPLLIYADDDADWQVRLTAVHFLGKAGPGAADALYEVAKREPCPYVRLHALRGLSRLGREGEALYREVLTPEDEDRLARMPKSKLMGKTVTIDTPQGDMTKEFFDGDFKDPRVCASSERAGRLKKHLKWPRGKERKDWSHEVVVTPEVTVGRNLAREAFEKEEREYRERERRMTAAELGDKKELDAILAEKTERPGLKPTPPPEPGRTPGGPRGSFPAAGPGMTERVVEKGGVRYAETERPGVKVRGPEAPLPKNDAKAETMPAAPAGLYHEGPEDGKAEVVEDKGKGKVAFDPLQELMKRLRSSGDARVRARAADELGKRGRSAAAAAPALRRALKDADRRVRSSAALALGTAGAGLDGVEKDLERARRDKDEDVRFSAFIALRRLRGE